MNTSNEAFRRRAKGPRVFPHPFGFPVALSLLLLFRLNFYAVTVAYDP